MLPQEYPHPDNLRHALLFVAGSIYCKNSRRQSDRWQRAASPRAGSWGIRAPSRNDEIRYLPTGPGTNARDGAILRLTKCDGPGPKTRHVDLASA